MSMFHWKTDEMVDLLSQIPEVAIEVDGGYGCHATNCLRVHTPTTKANQDDGYYAGSGFFITGWNPEEELSNPENAEIDFISVSDGLCGSGGLTSDCVHMIQLYSEIRKVLAPLGVTIINHHDEIF